MRPHELIDSLMMYADAMAQAATRGEVQGASRARLNFGAAMLVESAELIVHLQERLVRQACHLEHIEAAGPRWPLLEDDDSGASL